MSDTLGAMLPLGSCGCGKDPDYEFSKCGNIPCRHPKKIESALWWAVAHARPSVMLEELPLREKKRWLELLDVIGKDLFPIIAVPNPSRGEAGNELCVVCRSGALEMLTESMDHPSKKNEWGGPFKIPGPFVYVNCQTCGYQREVWNKAHKEAMDG